MAILATERWIDRRFQKGQSATRAFDVTGVASQLDAGNAVGIAARAPHPSDDRLKAEQPDVTNPGGPNIYRVVVQYTRNGASLNTTENPLDDPPRIRWSQGSCTEQVDVDAEGNALLNSALDPIDPPLTRDFGTLFLTVTRNESTYDVGRALAFQNKCNEDAFPIFGAGTVESGQIRVVSI